jgi:hypothetical protein
MKEKIQFQRRRCEVVLGKDNRSLWACCFLAYPHLVRKLIDEFERMPWDDEFDFCNRRNIVKEVLGLTEEAVRWLESQADRKRGLKMLIESNGRVV